MSFFSRSQRLYDITVYGATGYTGRLIAQYLASRVPSELSQPDYVRVALAGRSSDKLEALRRSLNRSDFKILTANLQNQEEINTLAASTRVLIAAAGPFAVCGEPLVSACVRSGTDYLDITGEAPWVGQMIEKYGEPARSSGSILVPMAGFDSVPSDLGCFLAVQYAKKCFTQPPSSARSYFAVKGGASGGTLRSIFNLLKDGDMRKRASDTLGLCGNAMVFDSSKSRSLRRDEITSSVKKMSDVVKPAYSDDVQQYVAPFIMAGANTRVVRRSAALASITTERYSPPNVAFGYDEVMLAKSWIQSCMITFVTYFFMMLLMVPGATRLGNWLAPASGEGPSDEKRSKGKWEATSVATTATGRKSIVNLSCDQDAYDFTGACVSECAILLATKRSELPALKQYSSNAFLTPATAFGNHLESALEKHAHVSITKQHF